MGPWVNPARGRITSRFGPRWGGHHSGTDIAPSAGYPFAVAANAGVVVRVRTGSFKGDRRPGALAGRTGNGVVIDHGQGIQTYYGHLASVDVRVGQTVARGQRIGRIGTTGVSTGIHLHFEVLINGWITNPEPFMRDRGATLGTGRMSAGSGASTSPDVRPVSIQMRDNPIAFTFRFTTPRIR